MSEVQSAISQVSPHRGRRPVVLKDGTPLADARKAAREAVIAAKTALRDAKTTAREAVKAAKVASSKQYAADKQLTKTRDQRFVTPAEKKAAVNLATEALKAAKAETKTAEKAAADAQRAITKATADVSKAEAARLKVEERYQASKAVN